MLNMGDIMIYDKKFIALISVTLIIILGIISMHFVDASSVLKYTIAIFGEFVIIIISAFIGFKTAKKFTFKSAIGKSTALISVGILVWGLGNMAWLYYNIFEQIEIPYPSLADVGYLGMIPLAAIGLFILLRNVKIIFNAITTLKLVAITIIAFLPIYWLFIQSKMVEDVPEMIKILNVAYPVGDIIFLSLALIILSTIKSGAMSKPIGALCVGFIIEAIADFIFSWQTSTGTYYAANFGDIFYSLAFFTIGLGMYYINKMTTISKIDTNRGK
jgi:hypothetical protein